MIGRVIFLWLKVYNIEKRKEVIFLILSDFNFGSADASKEYVYHKNLLENGFHDPYKFVERLVNEHKFLVVGRKGVGKTAILSKIDLMSNKNDNTFSYKINLADLEYNRFKKTKIDKDVTGSNKYKNVWEFLLLVSLVKFLYKNIDIENEHFINLISFLENVNISIDELQLKNDINFLSKLKVGANIKIFSAQLEKDFNEKPEDYSYNIVNISDKIKAVLNELYLRDFKVFVLIDGLDDVLRYKVDQNEIIKSLIRSIDSLNMYFHEKEFNAKVVLSIREDILSELNDPDMNKIKRDGSINVDWRSKKEELINLIYKRLSASEFDEELTNEFLNNLLTNKVRDVDVWDYILDRTLYKPRDILQFFITCQNLFPDNDYLNSGNIKDAVKDYSNNYLIEEMKDELTGFTNDEYIVLLPDVFKMIGNSNFRISRFTELINKNLSKQPLSNDDAKYIISLLYNSGYIGQLIRSGSKTSVQFKYRNPSSRIDFNNDLIIHTGIKAGLGIAL